MVYIGKATAWRCALAGFFALFFSTAVLAADEMSPAALLKQSIRLMEAGKYDDAASTMYQYLETVGESQAPRVITIAQDIRFKLAGILIQAERLEEAAEVLQKYIELPLGKHPRQALKMLATCYYETEDFENCVTATTNALEYNENPVLVVKKVSEGGSVRSSSTSANYSFNSNMVRLKAETINGQATLVLKFQFQYGAIKRHSILKVSCYP